MRANELEDVCEQLEFMAEIGRSMIKGIHPDAEVPIRAESEQTDRAFLHLASFMWAARPGADRQ